MPGSDSGQPAKSANKDEWVDHAVSQGADRQEAEGRTKQELMDEYGEGSSQGQDSAAGGARKHRLMVPQVIDGKEYAANDEVELTDQQAAELRAAGVVTMDATPEARASLGQMGGTSNLGGPPETGYDRMAEDGGNAEAAKAAAAGVPADENTDQGQEGAQGTGPNSASPATGGVNTPSDGENS